MSASSPLSCSPTASPVLPTPGKHPGMPCVECPSRGAWRLNSPRSSWLPLRRVPRAELPLLLISAQQETQASREVVRFRRENAVVLGQLPARTPPM
ncbi:hypothetical protein DPEC_G00345120 [Dallia pectoralis]|uniref:Uncharacterized protein n=1 Tax=Dallia pectoralis TaxID=75939 RepID=A0ACC2F3F5_DALPE|nr:hypothetical protein DPEC_G00345120 [Dallia pectoralis]